MAALGATSPLETVFAKDRFHPKRKFDLTSCSARTGQSPMSVRAAAVSTLFDRLAVGFDDGSIGQFDHCINDGRRRLAAAEMRLDRGLWCIR